MNTIVGIFFGTSTGSTQEAADLISAAFGDASTDPIDIEEVDSVADEFSKHDALILGTPTWNTGADTERSGTGWDEIYYSEMQELDIAGKKVAVFGLGDSISYSENYGDATGELHDVFETLNCKMMGYTSQEGYEHDDSKAIRGDKFCGLLLDAVNQEELTDDRVKNWVDKLIGEGFLENSGGEVAVTPPAVSSAPKVETADEVVMEDQALAEEIIADIKETRKQGYVANYNPRTDKTMWISTNGKSSFVTSGAPGYE